MTNFEVSFYAVPNSSAVASAQPYRIGTKDYNRYAEFAADITTAFGKTLPGGDVLEVEVKYNTTNRGPAKATLTATNYSAALAAIQSVMSAGKYTLDELLA